MDLLLRNGTIATDGVELNADLAIKDGVVKAIGDLADIQARETVDCSGRLILPGAVDLGLNLLNDGPFDPESDAGFALASRDAALGGVTTLVSTFDIGDAENPCEALRAQADADNKRACVDFGYHLRVDDWSDLHARHCRELLTQGIASVWVARTGLDKPLPSPTLLLAVLDDLPDGALVVSSLHSAVVSTHFHQNSLKRGASNSAESFPDTLEAALITFISRMSGATRARLLLTAISSAAGVKALQDVRETGGHIYGSTTVPHLYYQSDSGAPRLWPPARRGPDQQALFAALEDGLLSIVTSGHKPRTPGDLTSDVAGQPRIVGMSSLAFYYPVIHSEGAAKWRLSPAAMSLCCAADAAKLAGLYPRKGSLQPGSDADIVVINPKVEVAGADQPSESRRLKFVEPFTEISITGEIERVYLRGHLIVREHEICQETCGEFLSRRLALK